jgi:hypothetical protein
MHVFPVFRGKVTARGARLARVERECDHQGMRSGDGGRVCSTDLDGTGWFGGWRNRHNSYCVVKMSVDVKMLETVITLFPDS